MSTDQKRLLILSCFPSDGAKHKLKTIFSDKEESIRRKLENPERLRYAGWDLRTLDSAKMLDDKSIYVKNGNRKTVILYEDGNLIFRCSADEHFLSRSNKVDNKLNINTVALSEVIFNFFLFYQEVLADMDIKPSEIGINVKLHNLWLNNIKNCLANSRVDDIFPEPNDAPSNNIEISDLIFKIDDFKPNQVAYDVLIRIYRSFGFLTESVPYFKLDNGKHVFDLG